MSRQDDKRNKECGSNISDTLVVVVAVVLKKDIAAPNGAIH